MLRHNYEIGQLKKLVKNSSKVTKDEFLSHIGVHHTRGDDGGGANDRDAEAMDYFPGWSYLPSKNPGTIEKKNC